MAINVPLLNVIQVPIGALTVKSRRTWLYRQKFRFRESFLSFLGNYSVTTRYCSKLGVVR